MNRVKVRAHHNSTRIKEVAAAIAIAVVFAAFAQSRAGGGEPVTGLSGTLETMTPARQIAYLDSLLGTGVESAKIHFFLGNAYYAAEMPDSAIAEFQRALELDENYAKAYVNLGIVYDGRRKTWEARKAYTRAIEINPNDVLAYCHLGYNYYAAGEHDVAMDYYNRALEIDPDSPQAHYNLGLAFANAKIFNEALVEWRKVVELDPGGSLGKMAGENVELILKYMELGK
jgi:tetratricopeptide (TPR) repeat protein